MSTNPYDSITFGNSLSLRVDGAIGAMSLSPNGRDAVLAGRRGLFIIDMDDPFSTPRWLHHITSWEVADVQWSPHHAAKPSWCISTSNQKALLWDLARPSNNAVQNILHRHTRAITDINFHPLDPEMLATCSIDTFVLSWDMRNPRRPAGKWAEWRAGATQVKWNHSNPYQIVSSHHHNFCIWDVRHGAEALMKVENAHTGKINGLDFSGAKSRLITCSSDQTINIWDCESLNAESDIRPTVQIVTDYPVARARTLPFGRDQCCGIAPVRKGENSIHIVNYDAAYNRAHDGKHTEVLDASVDYSFKGHNGPIKDFLWRTQHEAYEGFESKDHWKNFQLVTWSSLDFDLKLWPHDEELYDFVNYNPGHQDVLGNLKSIEDEELDSASTPQSEKTEESVILTISRPLRYETYCHEPPISLNDLLKEAGGDTLSTLALYKLKQRQGSLTETSQLNHLNWISGVRMGNANQTAADDDGPSNLGEEVSIVGHKFPKVRFEKISVSTGYLVVSLRGPLPSVPESPSLLAKLDTLEPKQQRHESIDESSKLVASESVADSAPVPTTAHGGAAPATHAHAIPLTANAATALVNNRTNLPDTTLQGIEPVKSNSTEGPEEQRLSFIRLSVTFPRLYPFLEDGNSIRKTRKERRKRTGVIKFEIEETHELTGVLCSELVKNLDAIAKFYTNKYSRYCLEPCLRYLMGDKIDLDDTLMAKNDDENSQQIDPAIEVGNENWADDLLSQHEAATRAFEDDEEEDVADLIPAVGASAVGSPALLAQDSQHAIGKYENEGNKRDSTPLPKGCGAEWSHTGKLVCFFIPSKLESDGERKVNMNLQSIVFNRDEAVQLKTSKIPLNLSEGDEDARNSSSDLENGSSIDDLALVASHLSSSTEGSFTDDWDELLRDDVPTQLRIPTMFKGAGALEKAYNLGSNRVLSGMGTNSNNKSSLHDESHLRSPKRGRNFVKIIDYSHLLPDKLDLAVKYRLAGDTPERLAEYNCLVASQSGNLDLVRAWKTIAMVVANDVNFERIPQIQSEFQMRRSPALHWGSHPFGNSWLVNELLAYFEAQGNLQMLAMLSCIIVMSTSLENQTQIMSAKTASDSARSLIYQLLNAHGEAETELASSSVSKRLISFVKNRPIRLAENQTRSEHTSRHSLKGYASGRVGNSYWPQDELLLLLRGGDLVPRVNNSGSKIAPRGGIRRTVTSTFSALRRNKTRAVPGVTVELFDTPGLDLSQNAEFSQLLAGVNHSKLKHYMDQYSEMLYTWGLPYHRLEMLKFQKTLRDGHEQDLTTEFKCGYGFRYRKALVSQQQLLSPLTSIESAKLSAWNSRKRNRLQFCGLCGLLVARKVLLCSQCEHVLHFECAASWWGDKGDSETEDSEFTNECPTGCGCQCFD